MQQLKLIGPQDGHTNLIVEDNQGQRYLLPADAELLSAVKNAQLPASAPAEKHGAQNIPAELSPREIQSRIRQGASVDDLCYASGMSEDLILRYAQPVLDERAYIVQRAQAVIVAEEKPDASQYPSYHQEPATLADMVHYQLRRAGVDLKSLNWDAWRDGHGQWQVKASFQLPENSYLFPQEEPAAYWIFRPGGGGQVDNTNQWARVLSEDEPFDEPVAGRRLSAVDVFPNDESDDDRDALLELLRERRGTRLGSDEHSDEQLAGYIARNSSDEDAHEFLAEDRFGIPRPEQAPNQEASAHIRHINFAAGAPSTAEQDSGDVHEVPGEDVSDDDELLSSEHPPGNRYPGPAQDQLPAPVPAAKKHSQLRGQTDAFAQIAEDLRERQQHSTQHAADEADTLAAGAGGQSAAGEGTAVGNTSSAEAGSAPEQEQQDSAATEQRRSGTKKRQKRSSVPSWDEIVFGTRGE